ncbi:CHAT domain-containing protein [Mycolicibacterium vanbaalenii]|uniref:CHAT domain-containing protein n=1 Tax=Mycolicibacterium vanbaalenii (strain DSM 7251 / JCM 13017 / BCRC 16820 / KCTC 9966 / NRRL B-24157 / PYR-1) TaxID=350058 RepID=A1THW1_MYCVP|nr:CHAT domain-containing protein [Mycolicibacterium vanbaalenii]ABM16761.1 hypothetical protein Mvan_6006 [Mycolicibacterium vanbaalenii PYR-1]MCV7126961.1 CHAT domain-containing protein [Mycolicibacterium vanbaalenii PYR-1]
MPFQPVELIVECTLGAAPDGNATMSVQASLGPDEESAAKVSPLGLWADMAQRSDRRFQLGKSIFDRSGAGPLLGKAIATANHRGCWLRVVLRFLPPGGAEPDSLRGDVKTQWEGLVSAPWESMFVDLGGDHFQPVALALLDEPKVSIVRDVPQNHSLLFALGSGSQPTYLHIDGTNDGSSTIAFQQGERVLVQKGEAASFDDAKDIVDGCTSTIAVLHLTAHGEDGEIQIHDDWVGARKFATLVKRAKPGLLMLSVCNSTQDPEEGMVSFLEKIALPAFVGMQEPITVFANSRFVTAFFSALDAGGSLDESMHSGRMALLRSGPESGSPTWSVPVLYMNQETRKTPYLWERRDPTPLLEFESIPTVSLICARRTSDGEIRLLRRRSHGGFVWTDEPGGAVSLSPDGRLAAVLDSGMLWITTLGREGEFWDWPAVTLKAEDMNAEAKLLAVAAEGPDRATCLLSHESATVVVRVSTEGAVDQLRTLKDHGSYAGVLHAGTALLVNGGVRDIHTCEDFSQLEDVWAVDATNAGGQLRVAAVGTDKAGDRTVYVNGRRVLTLRPDAMAVGLIRELARDPTPTNLAVLSRGPAGMSLEEIQIPEADVWSTERWL